MNKKKTNSNIVSKSFYTYTEYKKTFLPNTETERLTSDNASSLGKKLAEIEISKLQKKLTK